MNHDITQIIDHIGVRRKATRRRFSFLGISLIASMLFIGSRGAYLQVLKGGSFRAQAEHNRVDAVLLPAPRGMLYDRNHVPLVENISSTDIVFNPPNLPAEDSESLLVDKLTSLLPQISGDAVREALVRARKTHQKTLITKALSHQDVLAIEQAQSELPGIELTSSLVRKYLFGESMAHLLGYTSPVTAQELEHDNSLVVTDTTGKQGIEKMYDSTLRGQHGFTYTEVNASGRQKTDIGEKPPVAGSDITLTIDSNLQDFIYGLFSEKNRKGQEEHKDPTRGAAIVLDPRSGAVLSLVSFPSYSPNVFSQPALRSELKSIFTDPRNVLFNRAVNGTYPPGSTIKPFLAGAALQEGIITESTTLLSTGGIDVGPWHFADWKPGGHGITDVKKAIAESVNTFFYMISGGLNEHPGLGIERATTYLKAFGFDEKTGIDLPSEAAGFLPSPEWKLKATGQPWYIGDTYHMGIGQGDVLVTPLQLAAGTASIANGTTWFQPHFIEQAAKKQKIPVGTSNIHIVQAGMRQTVTQGSARSLTALSIPIAGKTGTAQIGGTENTHAWFTSFGPYESPDYVVTVLLEEGGAGDQDAVPLAREIWQWLSEHPVKTE